MSAEPVPGSETRDRSFERLLEAAKAGSAAAAEELFADVWRYLLEMANRQYDHRLRGKVSASDLVQETLMTAQAQLAEFRGRDRTTLLAWLRAILRNDLLEAQRRYAVTAKRRIDLERPIELGTGSRVYATPAADPYPTPQTRAINLEESAVLRQALAALGEQDRLVIQLRNWELQSFRQIGDAIGKSEEAARKTWTRAVLRLHGEYHAVRRGGSS